MNQEQERSLNLNSEVFFFAVLPDAFNWILRGAVVKKFIPSLTRS